MRVLFTTTPGRGHVHPMVPLARALLHRGHDVAWAAPGDVAPRLTREGFEVMAAGLGEEETAAELARWAPELRKLAPEERPRVLFPKLFGTVRAEPMLTDLLPLARRWKPALIVHDQAELAAPIAAATLGVPNVVHSFGSLLPGERVAAAGAVLAPLWEAQGLEPRPFAGCYDHLYLDIYPAGLSLADASHVPSVQPLRPVAFAIRDEIRSPWSAKPAESDGPLVYITFGTVFNEASPIATAVEGVRELPVEVVVTVGPRRDAAVLGRQPPNVHVAGYIPQTDLLPHCAVVVSHAGSGTFLAALAHGLPQLLLPQAADQFLNADAGAGSGAAIALAPDGVSAETVRAATELLLAEPSFRSAAERVAREIDAMPSPDAVAGELVARFG